MDNMYPYIEYMKVLAAYVALLYIWPNVVFRKYLRGKGLTFCFLFCNTVQIVLLNGVILGLGLLQVLNVWVVRFIFYGAFTASIGIQLLQQIKRRSFVNGGTEDSISIGEWRWKTFYDCTLRSIIKKGKDLWLLYRSRIPEYLMLILILMFGMAYFSIGALHDYSYGCYDHYTHYRWIVAMKEGQIFPEGVYPAAMHCFIYGMRYLFGVNLHSCMLFLAGIQISAFLLAAYCLLKEIFQYRCIPLFVLTAWLTYDAGIEGEVMHTLYMSITRLTWTYPQEFGLYLVFLCPLFLLRFLQIEKEDMETKQWFRNENLFFLMLGVAASVSTHFYILILAFFLCIAVVIVYLKKMIVPKRILLLIHAVGYGMCIGGLPMLLAFIMGMYPEQSLRWGINRFNGVSEDAVNYSAGGNNFRVTNGNIIKDIYEGGYVAIFGEYGAAVLIIIVLLVIILCSYRLYLQRNKHKQNCDDQSFMKISGGYLFLTFASIIVIFLYAAPYLGLPEFVAIDRIFSIIKMIVFAVPSVLLDIFLCYKISWGIDKSMRKGVVIGCVIIYCFAYMIDFHEYVILVMKRYNAAVFVTKEIIEEFGQFNYRIVSMQDEKGQMEEMWRHEELLKFVQDISQEEYYLPVEYIFVYVEKRPVMQGQIHYFTGPFWLADKSSLYEPDNKGKSQCPNIVHTEISEEMAQQEVSYHPTLRENYFDLTVRTIICSKAYYWYQNFSEENPAETGVYYEDDDFVCYVIHQNPESPLNLASEKIE